MSQRGSMHRAPATAVNEGDVDLLYLHGFGCTDPNKCRVAKFLSKKVIASTSSKTKHPRLLTPCYHPNGNIAQTDLIQTIRQLNDLLTKEMHGKKVLVVGYSVGGYVGALLASMYPQLVHGLVLLAPAIDNYERNFQNVPESKWYMPASYVQTLRDDLPSRPPIDTTRTIIVHGLRDTDHGGSAPWRVREYVSKQNETGKLVQYYEPDIDHGLEPWLSWTASSYSDGWTNGAATKVFHNTPPLDVLVKSLL